MVESDRFRIFKTSIAIIFGFIISIIENNLIHSFQIHFHVWYEMVVLFIPFLFRFSTRIFNAHSCDIVNKWYFIGAQSAADRRQKAP